MRRLHLIEVEDEPWLPASIRDAMTDLLGKAVEVGRMYAPALPKLAAALRASGARRILDLCSGGGGPLPSLRRALARDHGLDLPARLSDLHPNLGAFARIAAQEDGRVEFAATPVDATAVPAEEAGFRTMFGCFHHFRPPQAAAILRDAWAQRRGLGIFEVSERSLAGLAGMTLAPLSWCR